MENAAATSPCAKGPVLPFGYSLEVSPAKTEECRNRLRTEIASIVHWSPEFVSVTYGANGRTRSTTRDTIIALRNHLKTPVATHLTCVDAPRERVAAIVDHYLATGIDRFVALRGDPKAGAGAPYVPHPLGFQTTADLVAFLVSRGANDISVAGYPERHPESPDWNREIATLRAKEDAGASRVITQFFFCPGMFLSYRDRLRAAGVSIPIVPGILPIHNFAQVRRFASRCGATIPDALCHRFSDVEPDTTAHHTCAIAVASELIMQLMESGVHNFHFFTMNRPKLTRHVLARFLRERPA